MSSTGIPGLSFKRKHWVHTSQQNKFQMVTININIRRKHGYVRQVWGNFSNFDPKSRNIFKNRWFVSLTAYVYKEMTDSRFRQRKDTESGIFHCNRKLTSVQRPGVTRKNDIELTYMDTDWPNFGQF